MDTEKHNGHRDERGRAEAAKITYHGTFIDPPEGGAVSGGGSKLKPSTPIRGLSAGEVFAMNTWFILVPLVVVIITFTYGVARSLLRVWLEHRLKLALLEKFEQHPGLFDSSDEVMDLLAKQEAIAKTQNVQDYTLTGLILALIGLGSVAAGRILEIGNIAVGIYIGGFVCIVLGVLIGLMGILFRSLRKNDFGEAPGA